MPVRLGRGQETPPARYPFSLQGRLVWARPELVLGAGCPRKEKDLVPAPLTGLLWETAFSVHCDANVTELFRGREKESESSIQGG